MKRLENEALYELLRMAVDDECSPRFFSRKLNFKEWENLHLECLKQGLTGVGYRAVCHLPRDLQPPLEIAFQWASEAETVKGQNRLLNDEAARLTELFAAQGRKTAVLKGPANARFYPDPYMRQAGDIDLWVDGGRKSVLVLLKKMGYEKSEIDFGSTHHVQLYPIENSVSVEIHYNPSSGMWNPFASARLLSFLEKEIQNVERVEEGFFVPSIKFALVMQLAHIMHHLVSGGIGFKQILDYYMLLKHSSEKDRSDITAMLSGFGLVNVGGALMWIMESILGLDRSKMLCQPQEKRGKRMLAVILEGGNFGRYARNPVEDLSMNFIVRWFKNRWRNIRLFWFAPMDVLSCELSYWKTFIKSISLRIKLRKLSLWDVYNYKYEKK